MGSDLAEMQLISKFNEIFRILLYYVFDICNKYTLVAPCL